MKNSILSMLEEFEAANLHKAAPKAVRKNLVALRKFVEITGVRSIHHITVDTVQQALSSLTSAGKSPKTVINFKASISTFCTYLRKRGHIPHNPCFDVEYDKPPETVPVVLDTIKLDHVLRLARQYGLYVEVAVAAYTGITRSELCRLEWSAVDLENRVLLVTKRKNQEVRRIPLLAIPFEALREQRALTGDLSWVFPARQTWRGGWKYVDRPAAPGVMSKVLAPLAAAVASFHSLPKGSVGAGWHLFRHTFAKLMLGSGISAFQVAEWMGHSDIRVLRQYARPTPPQYDPELEKILKRK